MPVDLLNNQPVGGLTGFLYNILPFLHCNARVYGLAVNRKALLWKTVELTKTTDFVPIGHVKHPSKIPLRLKALFFYAFYRSRILHDGAALLYVHSVESTIPFLFGPSRLPVVYHQHGSHNPVQASAFRYARLKVFEILFDRMLNLVHRKSDWVIAIDSLCLDQVRKSGSGHKVSLLMNSVNTRIFRPDLQARQRMRDNFLLGKTRVVLFVGRMEEGKGIDKIIEAIRILNANEGNYCAFIVGDGSRRTFFQQIARKVHVEHLISFIGAIPHNQLRDFYNMADVLLLPSEREGIPMVVLEALACGTPVVATDVGGLADIVSHGRNGILLNTVSPENLAKAILRILSSPIDRESIANGIEPRNAERNIQELEEIFLRLRAKTE